MKVTTLETIQVTEFPNLVWVRIHTDVGLVGLGETFFGASTVAAYVHEIAAPYLLGDHPFLFVDPNLSKSSAVAERWTCGALSVSSCPAVPSCASPDQRVCCLIRAADPREPLLLADDVPSPLGARLELKLALVDASGGVLGTIGQAEVTT